MRANRTAVATIAPRIDEILVTVDAYDLAVVGAMAAHDLARLELKVIHIERKGMALVVGRVDSQKRGTESAH